MNKKQNIDVYGNEIDQFYRDWEKLSEKINSILPTGIGTHYRESVTGEEYITFSHAAPKDEGEASGFSLTPEEASKIFLEKFWEYVEANAQKDSKIYWRIQPQMREFSESEYNVRCRFLISNKQEIPERVACAPHPIQDDS